MQAIKDYENNKWKVIGQKVGKPAKVRILVPFSFFTLSYFAFAMVITASHRTTSRFRSHYRFAIHFDFLASISPAAGHVPQVNPRRPSKIRSFTPRNTASALLPRRQADFYQARMPASVLPWPSPPRPSKPLNAYKPTRYRLPGHALPASMHS